MDKLRLEIRAMDEVGPPAGTGGQRGGMAVGRGGLPVQEARRPVHRSSLTCGS